MGAPIFGAESRLDKDTLTASAAVAGFPKENLFDDRIFTTYQSSAATINIVTDSTTTAKADYFGVVGHDLGTRGASIEFAHSADNISYTPIVSVSPTVDTVIFKTFTSVTDRFFRAQITGGSRPVAIGEIQWGIRVEPPFAMAFQGFDPQDEDMNLRFTRSQDGNILGTTFQFAERRARVQIPLLASSFVRGTTVGNFQEFWDNHAGVGKPFFFQWCIDCGFEKDTFFGIVDPGGGINRPLRTPVAAGFRDIEFNIIGLKE